MTKKFPWGYTALQRGAARAEINDSVSTQGFQEYSVYKAKESLWMQPSTNS